MPGTSQDFASGFNIHIHITTGFKFGISIQFEYRLFISMFV